MVSIRGHAFGLPQLLLIALISVLLVVVLVTATTSTVAFSTYNSAWDGTSDLRDIAREQGSEPVVAMQTNQYANVTADSTTAIILSPDTAYSQQEAAHVRKFVRRGGTVVVAEDFGGHSNTLLAAIGAQARVDGRLLRDERYNYRSPNITVATAVRSNQTLTAGVDQLTLNHGTAIRPNGATPLINSSEYAYLDTNGNNELDDDEQLNSYPVVTTESVGDGRVVVVSDPSLFINAMLDRSGNTVFARNLAAGADTLLLDYSHTQTLPPLVVIQHTVQQSPLLQLLVGLTGVSGIAILFASTPQLRQLRETTRRWRYRRSSQGVHNSLVDSEQLERGLQERYPDLADSSLRQLAISSIKSDETQGQSTSEDTS